MGPPRFELESEDPQSPRMPGYPTIPCTILLVSHLILFFSIWRCDGFEILGFGHENERD